MSLRIAPETKAVHDLARPLIDAEIAISATDPRADHHRALAQEMATLPRAVAKRQREFAAGRVAAHRAMQALGVPVEPVLFGKDRAPVWPKGVTGSLTHTRATCLAAVARSDRYCALGLDVEEATPLAGDLIATICTTSERAWLSTLPQDQAGGMAKLIFSAKECAYKCQYVATRTLFGFDTFEVTPDPDTGQFEATFVRDVAPYCAGTRLSGRFAIGGGLIVTAMALGA